MEDQCFCAGKYLCFLVFEGARDAKTPRDGYHEYHAYQRSAIPVWLGVWSLYREMNSSSWQTTRPMMATMVPTSTEGHKQKQIQRYSFKVHGYRHHQDRS